MASNEAANSCSSSSSADKDKKELKKIASQYNFGVQRYESSVDDLNKRISDHEVAESDLRRSMEDAKALFFGYVEQFSKRIKAQRDENDMRAMSQQVKDMIGSMSQSFEAQLKKYEDAKESEMEDNEEEVGSALDNAYERMKQLIAALKDK